MPLGGANTRNVSVLRLFSYMIDSGTASPLLQTIREREGLVYDIETRVDPKTDISLFIIATETDAHKVQDTRLLKFLTLYASRTVI